MDSRTEIEWLSLRLLGPVSVCVSGREVTSLARKPLALLAYIARRAGQPASREGLAGLFWADSGEDQARASLRQALSALRRELGETAEATLDIGKAAVRLRPEASRTDVAGFEAPEDATEEALAAALDLYRGDFLEDFPAVTPEFDRWLEAERGALRSRFCMLGLKHVDACREAGRIEEAIARCRQLLRVDPLQEHVHRRLIRGLAAQRRHDAALKQFSLLRELLRDELGVEPEAPTLALYREIQNARRAPAARGDPPADPAPRPASASPPAAPTRPSLAVLPFRSLQGGEEAELFGEGLAEDTLIELSRDTGLMVVARQSSFRFSEDANTPKEIGEALGVRYLVGGSVRVAGNRARVAVHLVACETGAELWAERYDRELDDIFAIQTEIARTVTATVIGRISSQTSAGRQHGAPGSLEVYTLVQLGQRELDSLSSAGFDAAEGHFARAVELAPDYGRAVGLLALARIYRRWYFDIRGDMDDLVPLAERAVRIDPRDARAHLALGIAHMIGRDWDVAAHHYEAALAANPNDDLVLVEYGRYLLYVDRAEDGVRRIREAMRLNPYHANWYWNLAGRCLHTAGRFEEALDAFRRVIDPPFYVYTYLAACHHALGHEAEAREARRKLYEARPDFDFDEFGRIFPYKNEDTARRFLATLRDAGVARNPG